jgi:predicted Zn finger-like uncharacterized protein
MLFTRCPDCDTTFRVTDDALKRANGQVRCGRCASVFNAYAERRDEPGAPIANAPSQRSEADTPATGPHPVAAAAPVPAAATQPSAAATPPVPAAATPPSAAAAPPLSAAAAQPSAPAAPPVSEAAAQPSAAAAPQPTPAEAAVPVELAKQDPPIRIVAPSAREEAPEALLDPDADLLAGLSVESVVAQLEQGTINGGADDSALLDLDAAQDAAIPPSQVEAVLETEPIGDWRHLPKEPARSSSSSNYWGVGVAVTVAMLAVQLVNHYRAELVKFPSVGSLVQSAYAAVGVVVLPRWDVRQYQILDWVATAEPSSGGIGSLRITARIKNLGPEYQPYPDVNLRLKDRWEAAVGGRVFAPAEYLAATPRKLMAPGETARAQLELVDPGPDAYGFDLDVCVEIETHVLSCRNDKVFL